MIAQRTFTISDIYHDISLYLASSHTSSNRSTRNEGCSLFLCQTIVFWSLDIVYKQSPAQGWQEHWTISIMTRARCKTFGNLALSSPPQILLFKIPAGFDSVWTPVTLSTLLTSLMYVHAHYIVEDWLVHLRKPAFVEGASGVVSGERSE